eukprot:6213919-Pleurochrysis_carterae.AAC.2
MIVLTESTAHHQIYINHVAGYGRSEGRRRRPSSAVLRSCACGTKTATNITTTSYLPVRLERLNDTFTDYVRLLQLASRDGAGLGHLKSWVASVTSCHCHCCASLGMQNGFTRLITVVSGVFAGTASHLGYSLACNQSVRGGQRACAGVGAGRTYVGSSKNTSMSGARSGESGNALYMDPELGQRSAERSVSTHAARVQIAEEAKLILKFK